MTFEEQLEKWINGESVHNDKRDECCPDFSCCEPELLADRELRERYRRAVAEKDEPTQLNILSIFLSAAFQTKDLYITGDAANYVSEQ